VSRNLVELIRRHHAVDAPTALEVLKEAMDDHGELTDADRKRAAEVSGLPEAAVYGVSTFYDDLLAPRGTRHVRVCAGTACFAAARETTVERVGERLGIRPGERSADGSVSLAETVCLGFCHSSPAIRVGDTVDAGPGVAERAIAGESRAAEEPEWVSLLPEPVLIRAGDWSGLRRGLTELGPQGLLTEVEAAEVRGRGGAGFPAGAKWAFAAEAEGAEKFIVANGDEGAHGFVLGRSEYPLSKPALDLAAASARERGLLGEGILGTDFDFDVTIIEGAGSYVVDEETALLACVQGLRGTVSARQPAIDPPGEARTDFEIIGEVARRLGHEFGWDSPWDALDEVARLTPHYAGVSRERLGRSGLQWPVRPDGSDSPTLYDTTFDRPGGHGHFAALPYKAPGDAADEDFPLVLVTGRILQHYNAGTMTRRTANAILVDRDLLEVHPLDAERLWIKDGDRVSVRSRVGRIEVEAKVTERIEPGHVFTTFHFPETRTNLLVGQSADVNTSCPEYKVIAVDVRPIGEQAAFTPVVSDLA
jgi:NADH:ubiquinone oxidoreductase subunit E/formylmethanofuran dehydrogenase subunit D